MATRATFVADFTSFERAVQQAQTHLRSFQSGAAQVEKQLARVGDSFSGRKVLQEATLAVKAVEDLGGVSKLTAKEQASLNSVVTEALAKYRALGLDAPRNLVEIERATRQVDQATGGLSTKMVAIGTAIGTFVGRLAVDAVKALGREVVELATNGVKLAPVVTSFERLTASIGESADAMLGATRMATKGLIKDLDVMQAANKAMLLGLPVTAQEFGTLSAAAVTLGKAMGQGPTKSLDDFITALGRSSPLILDNLGLTVKVGEANEQYARSLGKSASELTEAEKKMAFYTAAVEAARQKTAELGGVQLTMVDQLARLKINFTNFTDALGVAIARSPVLNELLGGVADAMDGAFGSSQVTRVQALIKVVNDSAIAFVDVGLVAIDVAEGISRAYHVMADTVRLDVGSMARAILGQFRETIDILLATTAALRQFDPTGMVDRNFKLLVAMRAAMESAGRNTGQFQTSLDAASASLATLRERLVRAAAAQVNASDIAADLTRGMGTLGQATDETGAKAKKAAEAYAKLMSDVRNAQQLAIREHDAMLLAMQRDLRMLEQKPVKGFELVNPIESARRWLRELESTIIPGFKLGDVVAQQLAPAPRALAVAFERVQHAVRDQLGPTVLQALTGGGDIVRSVGGLLGGAFTKNIFGAGAQKALSSALGSTIGGAIGSVIPGIGTVLGSLAGPLVGKIGGFFKSLFGGPSERELEGRGTRKAFTDMLRGIITDTQRAEAQIAAAGGASLEWAESVIAVRDAYLATGRTADEGHRAHQRLLEAEKRGAEAVKKAMEEIQGVFDEQRADVERLEAAIQRYGFTLEELGPKFRQQQLTEQAKELIEDWRVLVNSGIDLAVVNSRMAESINEYLQMAVRTGTEVPAAMRPILQALIDQGQLVDANGEAITDFAKAGITFAETMTQGFDRVVAKLQQLIDRLQGAGAAIEDLPSSVVVDVEARLQSDRLQQQMQEAIARLPFGRGSFDWFERLALDQAAIPMAAGGSGRVTRPTLFLAGEAGPEEFAFSGAGRSFGDSDETLLRAAVESMRNEVAELRREMGRFSDRIVSGFGEKLATTRVRTA